MSRLAPALVAGLLCVRASLAQDLPTSSLETWPGVALPEGAVTGADEQSVTVRPHDPAEPILALGWHQIRSIPPTLADDHRPSAEAGRAIWRAGVRLDRGDHAGALALLEPLEDRYRGRPGPTSVAYFRALLRARLARLDRPSASRAWLELRAVSETDPGPEPQLVPLYASGPVPARAPGAPEDDPIAEAHAIAGLVDHATQAGLAPRADALFARVSADDPFERLHAAVVGADLGSPDVRVDARDELADLAVSDNTYRGTWARLATARSLSREADDLSRRLAIAAFVEVSIRDQGVAPILAGFALAEAAVAAQRNADPSSAQTLAAEFRERFPCHPANLTLPGALEAARQSTPSENDA
ncbi:MAG: hypothetical protein ACF8Q5_06530 [Phycisphaerales bacterium JB040]